jgi:hypothetical protein
MRDRPAKHKMIEAPVACKTAQAGLQSRPPVKGSGTAFESRLGDSRPCPVRENGKDSR